MKKMKTSTEEMKKSKGHCSFLNKRRRKMLRRKRKKGKMRRKGNQINEEEIKKVTMSRQTIKAGKWEKMKGQIKPGKRRRQIKRFPGVRRDEGEKKKRRKWRMMMMKHLIMMMECGGWGSKWDK